MLMSVPSVMVILESGSPWDPPGSWGVGRGGSAKAARGSARHTQVRPAGLPPDLLALVAPAGPWDWKHEQKASSFLCNRPMCLQPVPGFHHLSFNQSIPPATPESHLYLTFHHLDSRICQFLPGG